MKMSREEAEKQLGIIYAQHPYLAPVPELARSIVYLLEDNPGATSAQLEYLTGRGIDTIRYNIGRLVAVGAVVKTMMDSPRGNQYLVYNLVTQK